MQALVQARRGQRRRTTLNTRVGVALSCEQGSGFIAELSRCPTAIGDLFLCVGGTTARAVVTKAKQALEEEARRVPRGADRVRALQSAVARVQASSTGPPSPAPLEWLLALQNQDRLLLLRAGRWEALLVRGGQAGSVWDVQRGARSRGTGPPTDFEHVEVPLQSADTVVLLPSMATERLRPATLQPVFGDGRGPQVAAQEASRLLRDSGYQSDLAIQVLRFSEAGESSARDSVARQPVGDRHRSERLAVAAAVLVGLVFFAGMAYLAVARLGIGSPASQSSGPTPTASAGAAADTADGVAEKPEPTVAGQPAMPAPTAPPCEPGDVGSPLLVYVFALRLGVASQASVADTIRGLLPGRQVQVEPVVGNQLEGLAQGFVYWREPAKGDAGCIAQAMGLSAAPVPPDFSYRFAEANLFVVPGPD